MGIEVDKLTGALTLRVEETVETKVVDIARQAVRDVIAEEVVAEADYRVSNGELDPNEKEKFIINYAKCLKDRMRKHLDESEEIRDQLELTIRDFLINQANMIYNSGKGVTDSESH